MISNRMPPKGLIERIISSIPTTPAPRPWGAVPTLEFYYLSFELLKKNLSKKSYRMGLGLKSVGG